MNFSFQQSYGDQGMNNSSEKLVRQNNIDEGQLNFLLPSQFKAEDCEVAAINTFQISKVEVDERRGCCSWHGGVCGCSYGTVTCCDGSYSPSCRCK
jgi:hypothetical protein